MKAGKVVLALDGMGGDHAPDVVVNGADIARERYPDTSYLLFGDPEKLKPLVDKRKGLAQAVEIVPAADAVSADDKPSFALRRRRQSSMWLACQAAAEGRADTVVSAGNTGALLAISMFAMRMLDGAHRPALASFLPTTRGETVMLDLGANLECDADNLAEFAVMGSVFAQVLLGLDAPKVGLLNVGSEELKGHEELRQAAGWLRRPGGPVNFYGFVEGNDIGSGVVDVVVTDGFTGNVLLKGLETAYALVRPPNPGEVPPRAAILLGVGGTVVICHGAASGDDIAAGIALAAGLHRRAAVPAIADLIQPQPAAHDDPRGGS